MRPGSILSYGRTGSGHRRRASLCPAVTDFALPGRPPPPPCWRRATVTETAVPGLGSALTPRTFPCRVGSQYARGPPPETLQELASLGSSMRAAQTGLETDTLRSLSQRRKRLLSAASELPGPSREEHGRGISGAVAAEVEQTLRAATADQGAAEAVQSGLLLRSLAADGLFDVDLSGAVAAPARRPDGRDKKGNDTVRDDAVGTEISRPAGQPRLSAVQPKARPRTPAALDRALAELQDAERAAGKAAEEAVHRSQERADAAASVARLADEVGTLQAQLARAVEELKRARKAHEAADADALQSARSADKARRKESLARERVLRLSNTPER